MLWTCMNNMIYSMLLEYPYVSIADEPKPNPHKDLRKTLMGPLIPGTLYVYWRITNRWVDSEFLVKILVASLERHTIWHRISHHISEFKDANFWE